jgi:anti-anti-sigma regulatory factor
MPNDPVTRGPDTVVLDRVQTLQTIDATKDILEDRLGRPAPLVVDCSQVDDVDLSVIQLLLSARKTAGCFGGSLLLAGISPALRGVLERCGMVGGGAADPFWNGGRP